MVQTRSGKRTDRLKWTEKMLKDLLYCKKKALSITNGKKPPMKNGKKIGYIAYMHQLWIKLGYEKLGKTPNGLSAVANRAEKKFDITSNMLMSTSSSSTSYGNSNLPAQEVCQSKEDAAREAAQIGIMEETKKNQCHYYKMSLYAALLAIFMMLSLVFGLLYSRCYVTFGDLIATRVNSNLCGKCDEHAYCEIKNSKSTCVCEDLYVGDGRSCHAISFATKFNENTNDYPELSTTLTKSSDLSFCAWLSISVLPHDSMNIFSYTSEETGHEFRLILMKDKVLRLIRNEQTVNISVPFLVENYWNHYCANWQLNGRVKLYINYLNRIERRVNPMQHVSMLDTFSLGGSTNKSSSFNGAISQLFLYNKTLSKSDVLDSFRYRPSINDLLVNWRNFSLNVLTTKCIQPSHITFPVTKNLL